MIGEAPPDAPSDAGAGAAGADDQALAVDVVERIGPGWDAVVAGFGDLCLEQSAAYMVGRWGDSRLCGLILRTAMSGEPEAAALAVVAAVPILKAGLAYVKFGPLWRRRDRPARPQILRSALSAIKREFCGLRGLLTRIMPPADPDQPEEWTNGLEETGFHRRADAPDDNRYLVDLSLTESEQLASLGSKWRANLKKASQALEIREVDAARHLPDFTRLYAAMSARKHFVDHHRIAQLPRFVSAAEPAFSTRLFLAYADARPVAGSLVVVGGARAFVPFSASSEDALPLRAGYALRWSIINRLRGSPARWLDLGGDEGDDGLRHFKAGNVGRRGRIVAIPGEFDSPGNRLSAAAAGALSLAHRLSRSAPLLTRR